MCLEFTLCSISHYRYRLPCKKYDFVLGLCWRAEDDLQQLPTTTSPSAFSNVVELAILWQMVTWHWRLSPRMTTLHLSQTCCLHNEFREWSTSGHRFSQTTVLWHGHSVVTADAIFFLLSSSSTLFSSRILHFHSPPIPLSTFPSPTSATDLHQAASRQTLWCQVRMCQTGVMLKHCTKVRGGPDGRGRPPTSLSKRTTRRLQHRQKKL